PAARPASRFSWLVSVVRIRIGRLWCRPCARTLRMKVSPSITGMLRSVMIRSKSCTPSLSSPSWPLSAWMTSKPAALRVWRSIARMVRESSTVRTRIELSLEVRREGGPKAEPRDRGLHGGAGGSDGKAGLRAARGFPGAKQQEEGIGRDPLHRAGLHPDRPSGERIEKGGAHRLE